MSRMRTRIVGTGSCVPKKVLTNRDLEKMVETSDDWIRSRTGITERRIADKTEAASDLAYHAAREALSTAGLSSRHLDVIIVGTISSDMLMPTTACLLQKRLGARRVGSFDVAAACSGFLYGLAVADGLIRSGQAKTALVAGVDILSRFTNYSDRNTCILFGDAAGAAVLTASQGKKGILSTHLFSTGTGWENLHIPAGGSRHPASPETVRNKMHMIRMEGKEVFKIAVRAMEEAAVTALRANFVTSGDVSLFIPHQANLRIIRSTASKLSFPMDRVFINVERYGNTSAASIPLAMDEALRMGRISPGDLVLMASFGGAFTWASSLVKW